MRKLLVLSVLFAIPAFAQELSLSPYVKMQESLAADNFKDSLANHKTLCESSFKKFKSSYKDCGKDFKSIEELRSSFKKISELYFTHGNKKEIQELQKASCPMAEARWIQKKGDLRNPYYGKSMLECGEKI